MDIKQLGIFAVPIFKVAVPDFRQHHEEIIALFKHKIESGELKPHGNGYGYQTSGSLFFPGAYKSYFVDILGRKFIETCEQILHKSYVDFDEVAKSSFGWLNTLTIGWATIQTSEIWTQAPPWHSHVPATLSGCYYVSTASQQDEGQLEFLNPMATNLFQPREVAIQPQSGHMIVFPSFLRHRPSPCPNTTRMRIAICMDSSWTLQLQDPNAPKS